MLKAVIDTNIWISALLKSSLTRPVLEAFIKEKFTPVISNELLKELNDTLNKSEIAELIKPDDAKELIALIAEKSKRVEPAVTLKICRDPEDNFILALSKASGTPLVTLDKDLLVLSKEFNIISPGEFLKLLKR
ncbi:MAG TPA: putative toxin-antitoxin system toxin component, PIN family [Candidatus Omnitrophica bacterium]|nr:putative toxin-antitoxin system toxin component, PIN family [Candidatus Omnitrophota bacterium]